MQLLKGRNLIIATKHKEKVIAPLIEAALGVTCLVYIALDTDQLGTFTGEVDRKDDPFTTARNKCLMAMDLYNCDLAIANEGSFGPHPSLFFVPADDEVVLFLDRKNNLEIGAREVSIETNYGGAEIKNVKQLEDFALRVKFPHHGLIVRRSSNEITEIRKGITDWDQLSIAYNYFLSRYGTVYVETDMRAMVNPTRMKVIEIATQKLINKIKSCCPTCNFPGFGVAGVTRGLPCSLCNFPTRAILSHQYSCQKVFLRKKLNFQMEGLRKILRLAIGVIPSHFK